MENGDGDGVGDDSYLDQMLRERCWGYVEGKETDVRVCEDGKQKARRCGRGLRKNDADDARREKVGMGAPYPVVGFGDGTRDLRIIGNATTTTNESASISKRKTGSTPKPIPRNPILTSNKDAHIDAVSNINTKFKMNPLAMNPPTPTPKDDAYFALAISREIWAGRGNSRKIMMEQEQQEQQQQLRYRRRRKHREKEARMMRSNDRKGMNDVETLLDF